MSRKNYNFTDEILTYYHFMVESLHFFPRQQQHNMKSIAVLRFFKSFFHLVDIRVARLTGQEFIDRF